MDGAANGTSVVDHLVDGDGEGVFVAEDDIASESPTRMKSMPASSARRDEE